LAFRALHALMPPKAVREKPMCRHGDKASFGKEGT
jgi:hypothetical protein